MTIVPNSIATKLDGSNFFHRARIKFWLWMVRFAFGQATAGLRSKERYELSNCLSKKRFRTAEDCMASIATQRNRPTNVTTYLCHLCDHWHKTSRTPNA